MADNQSFSQSATDAGTYVSNHVPGTLATGITLGTLVGWLPSIAAILAIILYGFQIYEGKTVQGWLARWRSK